MGMDPFGSWNAADETVKDHAIDLPVAASSSLRTEIKWKKKTVTFYFSRQLPSSRTRFLRDSHIGHFRENLRKIRI